jgi:hypothetical protein
VITPPCVPLLLLLLLLLPLPCMLTDFLVAARAASLGLVLLSVTPTTLPCHIPTAPHLLLLLLLRHADFLVAAEAAKLGLPLFAGDSSANPELVSKIGSRPSAINNLTVVAP